MTVKAANGVPAYEEVSFGYGQRDPQVENIEPIQAVQLKKFDASGPEVALPGASSVPSMAYKGVGLVADSPTVARVYVSNNGAGAAQSVKVELAGYDAGTGRALPGSPLSPVNGELDALPAPAQEEERANAAASFNFRLPDSWARGDVTLIATADPAHRFPECAGCRANDSLALTGVSFTAVPALKFAPISLEWTEGTRVHAPADPTASVQRTWPFWPLPAGGLDATRAPVHVDLTEALASTVKALREPLPGPRVPKRALPPPARVPVLDFNTLSLTGCLGWKNEACANILAPKIFAAERAALGSEAGNVLGVGIYDDTGHESGVLGEASSIPGGYNYSPGGPARAEIVVHEMLHDLGFRHSGCTPDEEAWPENVFGQAALLGFGIDRSLTSLGGIGPVLTTKGPGGQNGWHDVMSYCYPLWPSTLNWDRALKRLVEGAVIGLPKPYTSYPTYAGLTASTASLRAARARSIVTVSAVESQGRPVIAEVAPGAQAEGGEEQTPFVAQARNAAGRVIASVPIRGRSAHADVAGPSARPDEQLLMQFELPAAGAAALDIAQGGKVLAAAAVPSARPRLRVGSISRTACRRAGPLTLTYAASSGGGPFSQVRVLAQSGRSWQTIEVGAQRSRIVLARGSRPRGSKRLRVEFSDGFAASTATLAVPAGCRAG